MQHFIGIDLKYPYIYLHILTYTYIYLHIFTYNYIWIWIHSHALSAWVKSTLRRWRLLWDVFILHVCLHECLVVGAQVEHRHLQLALRPLQLLQGWRVKKILSLLMESNISITEPWPWPLATSSRNKSKGQRHRNPHSSPALGLTLILILTLTPIPTPARPSLRLHLCELEVPCCGSCLLSFS